MKKLDNREATFVLEYLISLDPKDAAIKAGYSASIAASKAYQWVSNSKVKPHVFEAIQKARQKTAERLELTRERVLAQYERLGFSDVRKFFDAYGQLKPISELDDDTAAAVQGFEVEMRQIDGADAPPVPVLKIKWADRKVALDSIMRAQGWNSAEKHEVTGKNGQPIQHAVRVVLVPPKEKAVVTVRKLDKSER